jgi:exodeoxyribonuclease VII small subunit
VTERSRSQSSGRKGGARKKKAADASADAPNPFAELPFEDALEKLEGIVDRLEEGDLDLADALARFEDGVQLTKHCQAQLEAAERRVEILTREGGDWSTRPFAAVEADVDEDDSASR